MNLSYSKLKIYQQCPLRYRFTYLDRLPRRPRKLFRAARRIHHALMTWLVYAQKGCPSLEDALRTYDQGWGPEVESDPNAARDYQEGREILHAFHETNKDLPCAPAYLEHKFEIPVGSHVVNGIIDRVELTERGYEVIDYKMHRELRTQQEVAEDLQLDLYNLALVESHGVAPDALSLYFVRHNVKMTAEARTRAEVARLKSWIQETGDAIASGREWEPRPGDWCSGCDFRAYCPAVSEDPIPIPPTRRSAILPASSETEEARQLALELT